MSDNKHFNNGKLCPNPDLSLNNISRIPGKEAPKRVKPKFYKMLGEIINSHIEVRKFNLSSLSLIIQN